MIPPFGLASVRRRKTVACAVAVSNSSNTCVGLSTCGFEQIIENRFKIECGMADKPEYISGSSLLLQRFVALMRSKVQLLLEVRKYRSASS